MLSDSDYALKDIQFYYFKVRFGCPAMHIYKV